MSIARTHGESLSPELLAWSSSFAADLAFFREDVIGSAAHVTMLAQVGLVPAAAAAAIRRELLAMDVPAAGEEDVHMAVEAELTRRLGSDVAGHLHTARSRNDQVALDLRLHVREQLRLAIGEVAALANALLDRAQADQDVLLPAYTHRQRAQPITGGFLFCAWATQVLRAGAVLQAAVKEANTLPLGSGACSGTSLPIDRSITQKLLGFGAVSTNALDTVGDRDFALDYTWGAARVMLALSRISTDVIDMATSEFRFVRLGGAIACGSSMMPQKRNPDMFELVRGQAAKATGHVISLLMLMKGLPTGYNRDQQEDRESILATGPLLRGAVQTMITALPHVTFDRAQCLAALADGFPQATDLAEALVLKGVPFREAYKATGALVRLALERGVALAALTQDDARAVHGAFDAAVLARLEPARAADAKESSGGTGRAATRRQIESLRAQASELATVRLPSLEALAQALRSE